MHRPATASCRERSVHVPSWGRAFAPSAQEGLGIPRKVPVTGALAEGRGQRAPPPPALCCRWCKGPAPQLAPELKAHGIMQQEEHRPRAFTWMVYSPWGAEVGWYFLGTAGEGAESQAALAAE